MTKTEIVKAQTASTSPLPTGQNWTRATGSLLPRYGFAVRPEYQRSYPGDGAIERRLVGFMLEPCQADEEFSGHDEVERAARAIDELRASLGATSDAEILKWLVELRAITASRQEAGAEAALALKAYVERLRGYPRQIIHEALIVETYKFFPTWDEMKTNLDKAHAPYLALYRALGAKMLSRSQDVAKAAPGPVKSPLTPEFAEGPLDDVIERTRASLLASNAQQMARRAPSAEVVRSPADELRAEAAVYAARAEIATTQEKRAEFRDRAAELLRRAAAEGEQ